MPFPVPYHQIMITQHKDPPIILITYHVVMFEIKEQEIRDAVPNKQEMIRISNADHT